MLNAATTNAILPVHANPEPRLGHVPLVPAHEQRRHEVEDDQVDEERPGRAGDAEELDRRNRYEQQAQHASTRRHDVVQGWPVDIPNGTSNTLRVRQASLPGPRE